MGRMLSADRDYGSADIELDLAYDKANNKEGRSPVFNDDG